MRAVLRLSLASAWCCALALAAPAAAHAQETTPDPAALAAALEHLDAARFDSARATLDAWQTAHSAGARERDRAAAAVLGARLQTDGVAAQHAWLSVALAHPFGADAGLALLRVGQAAVLQGDTAAAVVYLTRLLDDFPGSGHQAEAHLWLSRAHGLARHARAACDAARAGLALNTSAEVHGLLRLQEERACAPAALAAEPPRAAPPAGAGARAQTPPTGQDADRASVGSARWAVQAGAFRTRTAADALMARLRAEGFDPRLVRVPSNDLMRVRVGTFRTPGEAATLRDRVRAAGLEAVVVDDGADETAVP